MGNTLKLFLSFLLVYEPLAFGVLRDDGYDGMCRELFSMNMCDSEYKFAFMIIPVILMVLYLMWEKQIVAWCRHKQTPLKKEPCIKQRIIPPLEAMGRFWSRAVNLDTAQRSEYWGAVISYSILFGILGTILKEYMVLITLPWILVAVLPATTLGVRRWHDIGLPGYLPVILLILFLIGMFSTEFEIIFTWAVMGWLALSIIQFLAFLLPSKMYGNKYRSVAKDRYEQQLAHKKRTRSYANFIDDDDDI